MANPTVANAPFVRDRLTWLCYLSLAYFAYLQTGLGPLMPFIRAELDLGYTVASLHFAVFALGSVVVGGWANPVARRWGRSAAFWGAAAGMAAGALMLAVSPHPAGTIAAAALMGGAGVTLLVTNQAILASHHGGRRAVAITEANVAASATAILVTLAVGGAERVGLGWRMAVLAPVLAIALLAIRFRGTAIPDAPNTEFVAIATDEDAVSISPPRLPTTFWIYCLVLFLGVAGEWCVAYWGTDFLHEVVGLRRADAAAALSLFFMAMVAGRFLGSRLARRIASPRLLLAMLGIALVGFPVFWLAPVGALNLAGLVVFGVGVANAYPLAIAVATAAAPEQEDVATARLALADGGAALLAPLTLGSLAGPLGIERAFGVAWPLILGAFILTRWANRRVPG